MTNPTTRPISSPEDVFQFMQDGQEEYRRQIQMEDIVSHISRSNQLNWN